MCRQHLEANVAQRPEPWGVHMTRRHLAGYIRGLPGAAALRRQLFECDTLAGCVAILAAAQTRLRSHPQPVGSRTRQSTMRTNRERTCS